MESSAPKAYCSKQIPNTHKRHWDTRPYEFCYRECERKDGVWHCPVHGKETT
jgi:hypothetical protein